MNVLKKERQIQIVKMAVEGNSIRSIERMTGNHRDTIMRLLVRTGNHCEKIMDEHMPGAVLHMDVTVPSDRKQCVFEDMLEEYKRQFQNEI